MTIETIEIPVKGLCPLLMHNGALADPLDERSISLAAITGKRLKTRADHEEIARLAYSYWQARGCPIGSPEEDWYRAENELRQPIAAAAA